MAIEAAVAIGSGVAGDRLTLTAFGIDSLLRHGQAFAERAERTASRIGGALLFTLAAYVVATAGWKLWMQQVRSFCYRSHHQRARHSYHVCSVAAEAASS